MAISQKLLTAGKAGSFRRAEPVTRPVGCSMASLMAGRTKGGCTLWFRRSYRHRFASKQPERAVFPPAGPLRTPFQRAASQAFLGAFGAVRERPLCDDPFHRPARRTWRTRGGFRLYVRGLAAGSVPVDPKTVRCRGGPGGDPGSSIKLGEAAAGGVTWVGAGAVLGREGAGPMPERSLTLSAEGLPAARKHRIPPILKGSHPIKGCPRRASFSCHPSSCARRRSNRLPRCEIAERTDPAARSARGNHAWRP